MFATIAKILGSGDVIEKGLDLIDDMHTSDEEAIQAKAQAKINLMTAYAPFKVAQRYVALMFTGVYLGSFLLVLVMNLAEWGTTSGVIELVNQFYVGEIMLTIIAFYFSGGFLEGAIRARSEGQAGVIEKQLKIGGGK